MSVFDQIERSARRVAKQAPKAKRASPRVQRRVARSLPGVQAAAPRHAQQREQKLSGRRQKKAVRAVQKLPAVRPVERQVNQAIRQVRHPSKQTRALEDLLPAVRPVARDVGKLPKADIAKLLSPPPAKKKKGGVGTPLGTVSINGPLDVVKGAGTAALLPVLAPLGAAGGVAGQVFGKKSVPAQLPINFAKDLINIPAETVPSLAVLAQHPKETIKQFPKTDPIARLVLHGDPKGLIEHPGVAALDVSGFKGAVGRGLRPVAKTGALGETAKAATGERPPLKLYGNTAGGPEVPRSYSKDVLKGARQVRKDRKTGNVATGRKQARIIRQRVDEDVFTNEGVRREQRTKVRQQTRDVVKEVPKQHRPAVVLATARILRRPDTVAQDLHNFGQQLQDALKRPATHADRKVQKTNLGHVQALQKDTAFLQNPEPVFKAAGEFSKQEAARTQSLVDVGQMKPEEVHAKLVPYAVTHMNAVPSKTHFLEDAQGKPVTPKDVQAHMAKNGVEEPGFFSQRTTGANPYYVAGVKGNANRPALFRRKRTGAATQKGTFSIEQDIPEQQAARSQGHVEAAKGFDRLLNEFGLQKPKVELGTNKVVGKGFYRSYDEASRAGDDLAQHNNGLRLVPVNAGKLTQLKNLFDAAVPDEAALQNVSDMVRQAFEDHRGASNKYLLVPALVRDRLLEHVQPRLGVERNIQNIGRIFKESVLSGSTKWLTGNVVDTGIRSVVHGITPADVARGRTIVKSLEKTDPEAAMQLRHRTLGGNFVGSMEQSFTHKEPGRVASSPPGKVVAKTWHGWKRLWFGANTKMEQTASYGALGHHAKGEIKTDFGSVGGFFKVGDKAYQDYVQGLRGTPAQIKANRYVEQVLGRWGKRSPAAKRFLIQYAPFGQWLGVALKFVYVTLPTKHPIQTAVLASLNTMTEEERKKLGLDLFAGDKTLPPFLQGGIPTKKGLIRAQGYTSFGVTSQAPESLANAILPQASGTLAAFQGKDFTGKDLLTKGGKKPSQLADIGLGAYAGAESLVPGLALGRRVLEKGGKSAAGSTIVHPITKPGTQTGLGSSAGRVFNPIQPSKGSKGTPKKKKGSSLFGSQQSKSQSMFGGKSSSSSSMFGK